MSFNTNYLMDILVRIAYHSSSIEGNTISLPETISIILENTLPGNHKKIREFYEIENHRLAFEYILEQLEQQNKINLTAVKTIHALLMDRLQHDKGQFKSTQNAIVGADFKTATPQETPILMTQWINNLIYRLEQKITTDEIITILADTHIQFERIHPFSDGNGRTGRLIMLWLALQYLTVPVMINKDNRAQYMEMLATQNIDALTELLSQSYQTELSRQAEFN